MLSFAGFSPAAHAATAAATKTSSTTATTSTNSPTLQGYAADTALHVGTVVQLDGSNSAKVAPATLAKLSQMYGVTVDPNTLSLTLSSSALANEAYVATSGIYPVLVSTQNGPIAVGDYVTVSSVDGVGMKANPEQTIVLGRAAGIFDGKTNLVGNSTLKLSNGTTQKVTLGTILVSIDIRHNPNEKSTKANVPKVLQRLGEAIAEKPVGPLRIYLSIAITGICVVAAIVLLYSGVRNSLISIGRNPLSKKSIFRGLLEIIFTALIVLIIGLFAVYLLLKL